MSEQNISEFNENQALTPDQTKNMVEAFTSAAPKINELAAASRSNALKSLESKFGTEIENGWITEDDLIKQVKASAHPISNMNASTKINKIDASKTKPSVRQ